MRLKKYLEDSPEVQAFVNSLPKIYLVGCWAHYGIQTHHFTGKFEYDKNLEMQVPLVYQYDDHNGTRPEYVLRKITNTTTGSIITWSERRSVAQHIADLYEYVWKRGLSEDFDKFRVDRREGK